MTKLKLKSHYFNRRRFVKSEDNISLDGWYDYAQNLKEKILRDSSFQLVASKVIIEMNDQRELTLLFEVIGTPQSGFQHFDLESTEVLCFKAIESPFEVDFLTIKEKALALKASIPRNLTPRVQFVIDGAKLELHFFVQKDYIQS
ncbi:MAG: hypothetical protein HOP07_06405 [Bacteriovoracaceae bacterium]|nr:hypothetical protein [Bacteriovoracaceae bacterium]